MVTSAYKCILSSLHSFLGGGRMSGLALGEKSFRPSLAFHLGMCDCQEFVPGGKLKDVLANNCKEPTHTVLGN